MAKSVRSKIKRKHRSHFRSTIGEDAAKKNMETIQAKMQDIIGQGEMNSVTKLTSVLHSAEGELSLRVPETNMIDGNVSSAEGSSLEKKIVRKAKKGKEFTSWKKGCFTQQKKLYLSRKPKTRRIKNRAAF